MATALPDTTNMLKLVTVSRRGASITSSPEAATAGKFWVIQSIGVSSIAALDGAIGNGVTVSVLFGGTIVWQVELPTGLLVPFYRHFGAGLYTGVKNEDFTINVDEPDTTEISLSYGYF